MSEVHERVKAFMPELKKRLPKVTEKGYDYLDNVKFTFQMAGIERG